MPEKYLEEKEGGVEARKLWMKKINKFFGDYFKWIIALVVLVILIFGFFFLIQPKYLQTTRYISAISKQEESDFQSKKEELSKIKDLLSAYAGIDRKYIDKVNATAPIKKNKEELFSEINYLVSKNQLFLQSVTLGEVAAYQNNKSFKTSAAENKIAGNIEVVSVELSVKGTDYEAFKNFLATLENNLHLMDVVSVKFDPVGESTSLTINIYYTKQ